MNDFERRALDIAQSSTYLALYARQNQQILGIEYYVYGIQMPGLGVAGGGSDVQTGAIQIQSDSDFVLTYMSSYSTLAGTATNPIATLQIADTGTGKTFFNQAAPVTLVTGQGGFPFLLPAPRTLAPNTNLNFTVQRLDTVAGTLTMYFSLIGARIYYGASS